MKVIIGIILSVIYILVPALAGLFVFWSDSKKDGFDQERVYDLLIYGALGAAVWGGLSRLALGTVNPYSLVFGFVVGVSLAVLKCGWSLYRVLDNLSVSFVMVLAGLLLTTNLKTGFKPLYLLASILLFVSFALLQKYRGVFLKSGFTYCLISGILCAACAAGTKQTASLIFLALLFTLTMAVLIYRIRSLYARSKIVHSAPHSL